MSSVTYNTKQPLFKAGFLSGCGITPVGPAPLYQIMTDPQLICVISPLIRANLLFFNHL